MSEPQKGQEQTLDLAAILNILVRGRRVVALAVVIGLVGGLVYSFFTMPLYRATAQVSPGIVSYSDMGGPVREWTQKDIVRWFRTGLYWEDLRRQLVFPKNQGPPIILADYIPGGAQFQRGGEMILLTYLDPDPQHAVSILREAVNSFNRQATMDSIGSTIHLTMGGARVRMDKINNDIKQIEAEKKRTLLEIDARQRDIEMLQADGQRVELQIKRLTNERDARLGTIKTIEDNSQAAKVRMEAAQALLDKLMAAEKSGPPVVNTGDEKIDLLLQVVKGDQAFRVGDLLDIVDKMAQRMVEATVAVDTLRTRLTTLDLEIDKLRMKSEFDLPKQQGDVRQKIADLHLTLERDLPYKQAQYEADLRGEKLRLDLLVPLTKVGQITVTAKPVRPRKLRATGILTGLGLISGIFLVLAMEYYRRHRDAILAARE